MYCIGVAAEKLVLVRIAMWHSSEHPNIRTSHAVYDTQYHLVWAPKYRKKILTGVVGQRMKELLQEIAQAYDITIEEMEVSQDHVHIFCSFPPRLSITQVVARLKSLSARAIFRAHPQVKKQLWGGEFWEDGYFARTVGDKVTAEVIKKYIIIVKTKTIRNSTCSNLCR
jgi:putative transposase